MKLLFQLRIEIHEIDVQFGDPAGQFNFNLLDLISSKISVV